MQKTVLEMLKRGIFLILHFGRQSISPPPKKKRSKIVQFSAKDSLRNAKTWYFPYSAF